MEAKKRMVEDIVQKYATPLSIIAAGAFIALAVQYGSPDRSAGAAAQVDTQAQLQESVLPSSGVELPITWGDLGAKLVEVGAMDPAKMAALYKDRGGFPPEYQKTLEKNADRKIVITNWNAGYLLNLFWALGLANSNPILEDENEMMNPAYKGAGNFASTGGWTLAKGPSTGSGQATAMSHYNMHQLITLTSGQQALVDRISRNIYRSCCGNSTHFPDCNHCMAMLGLLELMASQGVREEDMWKAALAVNSYWFPDTYMTIATHMEDKGVEWKDVHPQEILGANYSSATGFRRISSQVAAPQQPGGGNGCAVDSGAPTPRPQSGCGI